MRRALPALFAFLLASCPDARLLPVTGRLRVEPAQVDFGRLFLGTPKRVSLDVINESRSSVEVTWMLTGDGFALVDPPARLASGSNEAVLAATASSLGPMDGVLEISVPGLEPLRVPLSAEGVAIPECPSPGACKTSAWDVAAGRCVESPVADGSRCSDACIENASCVGGRCVGDPKSCDDGDKCTVDSCSPEHGCEHFPGAACPGDGVCGVGACDPVRGCILAPAPDGTSCGPRRSCNAADVCISGQCVLRDPPDGFVCAEESPCAGEARCVGDVCRAQTTTTLSPTWSTGTEPLDGGAFQAWSDLMIAPDGGITVSSYFMTPPRLAVNSVAPLVLPTSARRCIHWRAWLVCADYPTGGADVSAIDPSTGRIAWTYSNLAADVPAFAPPTQIFLARLAAISDTLLLALFESRTLAADGTDPRCRRFAMVVLDATGARVHARAVEDPIFFTCNHPHSYGVAVDAQRNIYLGFAPSDVDNPAAALNGTTLMSYSPTLQQRWLRFEPGVRGGELAVARGMLFHHGARQYWNAATGAPAGLLPINFGNGVIDRQRVIPAPRTGRSDLYAIDLQSGATAWSVARGNLEIAAPLALAEWTTSGGPRTVVLSVTGTEDAGLMLESYDAVTGAPGFFCPLARGLPAPVQLEVGAGGVAAMGWPRPVVEPTECERCDPRFARTRNAFFWVPMKGIRPASAPWVGTWGGSGHDHREDDVP